MLTLWIRPRTRQRTRDVFFGLMTQALAMVFAWQSEAHLATAHLGVDIFTARDVKHVTTMTLLFQTFLTGQMQRIFMAFFLSAVSTRRKRV